MSSPGLTLDLNLELAQNDAEDQAARAYVDPRTIPTRFSLLKQMALSPAHYLEACQQPQDDSLAARLGNLAGPGVKRTEALRFGTAVHHFLLLGAKAKIARYSGKRDPRVKAWIDFQKDSAAAGIVEILSDREYERAWAVAEAVRRNDFAMRLLFDGTEVEQRIDWSWMGKAVRSTPDARSKKHLVDLKTAVTSQPDAFCKHGARLFYHAQASFYCTALDAIGQPVPDDCFVIAVEKTRPHPVTVMRFDADTLDMGAKVLRLWFERLLQCEHANVWPEYTTPPAFAVFAIAQAHQPFSVEIDGERVEV